MCIKITEFSLPCSSQKYLCFHHRKEFVNRFTPKSNLIDFTLPNTRRFYSSKGDPLGVKGWKDYPSTITESLPPPEKFKSPVGGGEGKEGWIFPGTTVHSVNYINQSSACLKRRNWSAIQQYLRYNDVHLSSQLPECAHKLIWITVNSHPTAIHKNLGCTTRKKVWGSHMQQQQQRNLLT